MLQKLLIAGAAVVAATSIAGGVMLIVRDGDSRPTSAGDTRRGEQHAEDTFITATAAHLCSVQSTVYDDPKAMADAYRATPSYPGLDEQQVRRLEQRLTSDPVFAARLSTRLRDSCKPQPRRFR